MGKFSKMIHGGTLKGFHTSREGLRRAKPVFVRAIIAAQLAALALLFTVTSAGCAETSAGGGGVNIVKNPEVSSSPTSGIPPDKEAEVQLLLQQRNPSTLKCYSDVLNEKHDRAFKGTVIVLLSLEPSGSQSKAADVKVIGGTMTDKEVTSCVVDKLKEFDYPEIQAAGTMQYVYRFEPAY